MKNPTEGGHGARHDRFVQEFQHDSYKTIEDQPEGLVLSTTDTHLPRRIGEALKHAHRGELAVRYEKDEAFVRVTWTS